MFSIAAPNTGRYPVSSPLGVGVDNNWQKVMSGHSGIGPITRFDPSGMASTIAGEAIGFEPGDYFEAKEARKMDRFIQLGKRQAVSHCDSEFRKQFAGVDPDNGYPQNFLAPQNELCKSFGFAFCQSAVIV